MFHNFLNPIKHATASLSELPATVPLAKWPRPSTSFSQPIFMAGLCLGSSKPSTSSNHLRLLYSSGSVAPGKTQAETDLGLRHPTHPIACAYSGKLQTMSEHHYYAPAQWIFGDQWSQPVLTADWPG